MVLMTTVVMMMEGMVIPGNGDSEANGDDDNDDDDGDKSDDGDDDGDEYADEYADYYAEEYNGGEEYTDYYGEEYSGGEENTDYYGEDDEDVVTDPNTEELPSDGVTVPLPSGLTSETETGSEQEPAVSETESPVAA